MFSNDSELHDRISNIERSVSQILVRLDRVENAKHTKNNGDDVLATTERLMRDVLLEMIKQQNIIERYRHENDVLREKLQLKPKEKESVSFSNTTTTIPSSRPSSTATSAFSTKSSYTQGAPTSTTTSATPSANKTTSLSKRTVAPKSASPAKQGTAVGKKQRPADEEDNESDEADAETPTTTVTQPTTPQKSLPVDFPPGYNPNRGRRFSVAGESLNPTSDLSSAPRTIVKKSEEAKRRIRAVITNNILFKNLDEDQLEDLVDEMFEVRLRPDEVVIRQGDDGDNFYIVDSGELYVLYRDVVVATIGSGKSFGEIALMYNCPRTATVRAKTDCILWGMSRGTFRRSLMIYAIRKRELYESFLARVPLLETLLPYERSIIADALEPKTYRDGDVLIRQGEKGDNFYILERGKVVVTKGDPPVEVKIYGEGDYFGELALLNDQPRAANVRAVGVVRVLTLSREDFANLMGPCEEILKRNMILYQQVQGESASSSASLLKPRDLSVLTQEFATEEANYHRNLQVLVTDFLVPLRKAAESNSLPITPEDVASMFSNVEMLLNIHNQLAPEASKIPSITPAEIAKVFAKAYPGLKFYNEYIKNWKVASEIIEKKRSEEPIAQFLKNPTRASQDLYSLLRAPVDRVPKIVAFLKDVFATTNDKDIGEVSSKLSTIGQ
jgi:cAMP-dependent protein kinase regulator